MSERYRAEEIILLFGDCYSDILNIICKSSFKQNYENHKMINELVSLLFIISKLTMGPLGKHDIIKNELTPHMSSFLINQDRFNKRIDFYGAIITKSINLRAESFANSIPKDLFKNPISRCAIAFCDILKNPKCLTDYSGAPNILLSISEDLEFTTNITVPIIETVADYAKKIIQYYKTDTQQNTHKQSYTDINYKSENSNIKNDNKKTISNIIFCLIIIVVLIFSIYSSIVRFSRSQGAKEEEKIDEAIDLVYDDAYLDGYRDGYDEGYNDGYNDKYDDSY